MNRILVDLEYPFEYFLSGVNKICYYYYNKPNVSPEMKQLAKYFLYTFSRQPKLKEVEVKYAKRYVIDKDDIDILSKMIGIIKYYLANEHDLPVKLHYTVPTIFLSVNLNLDKLNKKDQVDIFKKAVETEILDYCEYTTDVKKAISKIEEDKVYEIFDILSSKEFFSNIISARNTLSLSYTETLFNLFTGKYKDYERFLGQKFDEFFKHDIMKNKGIMSMFANVFSEEKAQASWRAESCMIAVMRSVFDQIIKDYPYVTVEEI